MVEHDGRPELLRALPYERLRAEQPNLLSVGEQDHHGVLGCSCRTKRPRGLEQDAHADPVVTGARCPGDRVVVGSQQDGPGRSGARFRRDHVADRGNRLGAVDTEVEHSDRFLDFGTPRERLELVDQVGPGLAMLRRSDWSRILRNRRDVSHRTGGAEGFGRCVETGWTRSAPSRALRRFLSAAAPPDPQCPPKLTAATPYASGFEGTICGRLDNPPDRGRHDPGVLAIGDQGLVAGALHDLEAGVLSQFRELALQGGQQLATDWLLADRQHDQRQVTERLGGVQLLAADRPGVDLRGFGG